MDLKFESEQEALNAPVETLKDFVNLVPGKRINYSANYNHGHLGAVLLLIAIGVGFGLLFFLGAS
jgi:hypothetical protein